jgi:hypothetical protein
MVGGRRLPCSTAATSLRTRPPLGRIEKVEHGYAIYGGKINRVGEREAPLSNLDLGHTALAVAE